MISVRFKLLSEDILDSYIYAGHLFSIFDDGTLRILALGKLYDLFSERFPEYQAIVSICLLRNDWFANTQAINFLNSREVYSAFKELWEKAIRNNFEIESDELDWQVISSVNHMPVTDIRLYGFRIYLAHRYGVEEAIISNITPYNGIYLNRQLSKVFDVRSVSLSAKAGEIIVSSGKEGLFHGTLLDYQRPVSVVEKPIVSTSFRTVWKGYDLVNYEGQTKFTYLRNKTEKAKDRSYRYSSIDESSRRAKISVLAEKMINMEDFLEKTTFKPDDILYSFNSSSACFFFLTDGRYVTGNILRSQKDREDIYLSSEIYELLNFKKISSSSIRFSRPISASTIPFGTVIEFFNQVVLFYGNQIHILENQPSISVRTFPTSIRFKRIVCITNEQGVFLHSVFPSEREIEQKVANISGDSL